MGYAQALFNTAYGRLAFGSITGTYATLLTVTPSTGSITNNRGAATILYFFNNLNADVIISLDGGTTDAVYLPANFSWTCDLSTGNMLYTGTIQVKHTGSAPASGGIACSVVRTRV